MESKSHRVGNSSEIKTVDHDPTDDTPLASLFELRGMRCSVSSRFVVVCSFHSSPTTRLRILRDLCGSALQMCGQVQAERNAVHWIQPQCFQCGATHRC